MGTLAAAPQDAAMTIGHRVRQEARNAANPPIDEIASA